MLSRSGSLDIDPSNFPPPPLSSATSVNDHSSPESISLSVLTGRSPRARPIPRITSPADHSIGTPLPLGKTTTPAEQLRSALERRARRIKESLMMLTSSDMSQINFNDETPSSEAQSLLLESTVATSVSHSRNISSASDFHKSISWNKPYSLDSFPRHESLPNTSTSASDTLLHQAQSSPPRYLGGLQPKPYSRSASPLGNAAVLSHTQSPDPSPRPELLFAIASDQPAEVERLLSTGKASANETMGNGVGLLEFTVTNGGLKNKTEIVKTLLKYGADPDALNHDAPGKDDEQGEGATQTLHQVKDVDNGMNPALKYYLNRQSLDIDSKPALDVLQQSSFAPLAKARFDIIGQDRALDELYRVLGTHSQRKGKNALVILLCGASGHGKSLLAQKVGSLLAVPTHTINMTALRSQHDLWQCLSTGMDDASPNLDLSEFLIENQGKRCVVVLDEIEKVDDSKSLNPLLLPWDIGRCSLEQKRHTDTSQVIWIATSNLGQKIIFEHVKEWGHPETPPTRDEYTQLATAIRRRIAEVLGASLLSRVTTILPFLPFTETEKIAIGTEAALVHQEFSSTALSSAEIEAVVRRAVKDVNFVEDEGARSLYRVVETHIIRARA
ncbi:P-loop containing nucleoside triphosphate hydrolase protein [Gautieria morchelliformis]|nr:P-loop containing nucleoside triphosphate hydrolase protein [Gautieria morchelliformis]